MFEHIAKAMGLNLDKVHEDGDGILAKFPPSWVLRVCTAHLIGVLLNEAYKQGPPPELAEKLGVTPEQARVIYEHVLKSAITRKEHSNG